MTKDVYRFRLSAMMFGLYLIVGSWAVTLATYLMSSPLTGGLNFSPAAAGWIYSTTAFAGILAPLFVGLLADRLFAAEKLMGCLHLLAAALLGAAAWWCAQCQPLIDEAYRAAAAQERIYGTPILELDRQFAQAPDQASPEVRQAIKEGFERINRSKDVARRQEEAFLPLFAMMFAYAFCNITTLTLSNVVVFRNVHDPQRSFGQIRLYGTVGWIAAGLCVGFIWNPISPAPLYFAAALSLAFGVFSFTLPRTPPSGAHRSLGDALGLPALSMFRNGSIRIVIACVLGVSIVQQFYSVYANRFLTELHAPFPPAIQTIAQITEVISMAVFPLALNKLGLKATLTLGLFCWVARNALFATASLPIVLLIGLPLHGMSYALVIVVASMYVDRKAPAHLRASAQGIFTFVSLGAGPLLGNWLSAQVVEANEIGDTVAWQMVWLTPAGLAVGVLLAHLAFFRETAEASVRSAVDSRL